MTSRRTQKWRLMGNCNPTQTGMMTLEHWKTTSSRVYLSFSPFYKKALIGTLYLDQEWDGKHIVCVKSLYCMSPMRLYLCKVLRRNLLTRDSRAAFVNVLICTIMFLPHSFGLWLDSTNDHGNQISADSNTSLYIWWFNKTKTKLIRFSVYCTLEQYKSSLFVYYSF